MSLLLALALLACGASPSPGTPPEARVPRPPSRPEVTAEQPTIVLMTLDAVRADRTSLCGHDRPTTPMLDDMEKRGGSHTCRAYAPAPWTLPSHASLLTGQPVVEHGVDLAPASALVASPDTSIHPLPDDATTLAETLAARGYQTIAVAADPALDPSTGLLQGFDETHTAPTGRQGWRGPRLGREVTKALASADPSRPMFLFVNVFDAHAPWPAVPAGADWVPERPSLAPDALRADASNPAFQLHRGALEGEAREHWLDHARDTYDWGVWQADRNVGRVLQELKQRGWGAPGMRMVVTSAHGTMLGEQGHLGPGGQLHEAAVRVPLAYLDTQRDEPLPLPEPLDIRYAHHLLLEGRLPDEQDPPSSVSSANPHRFDPGERAFVVWDDVLKLRRTAEGATIVDLTTDPVEEVPRPLEERDGQAVALLGSRWSALRALDERPVPRDLAVAEALRAMGILPGGPEDAAGDEVEQEDEGSRFDLLRDAREAADWTTEPPDGDQGRATRDSDG